MVPRNIEDKSEPLLKQRHCGAEIAIGLSNIAGDQDNIVPVGTSGQILNPFQVIGIVSVQVGEHKYPIAELIGGRRRRTARPCGGPVNGNTGMSPADFGKNMRRKSDGHGRTVLLWRLWEI